MRAPSPFDRNAFPSFDSRKISYLEAGQGRVVVLVHGFLASAERNWAAPGILTRLVANHFHVIAPDLRGHGKSARPPEPQAWPKDVLARDLEALIARRGLTDYDLVGYSLGARTVVRGLVRGLTPRRVVLGGMGDTGVMESGARAAMFRDAIQNGIAGADPRAGRVVQAMMRHDQLQPEPLLGCLDSFAPTTREQLAAITAPTLVLCGEADADNGSPQGLADALGNARLQRVPGDHTTAVAEPKLAQAIVDFLEG